MVRTQSSRSEQCEYRTPILPYTPSIQIFGTRAISTFCQHLGVDVSYRISSSSLPYPSSVDRAWTSVCGRGIRNVRHSHSHHLLRSRIHGKQCSGRAEDRRVGYCSCTTIGNIDSYSDLTCQLLTYRKTEGEMKIPAATPAATSPLPNTKHK